MTDDEQPGTTDLTDEVELRVKKPLRAIVSVRFGPDDLAELRAASATEGVRPSVLIRRAVKEYVARQAASGHRAAGG